MYGYIRGLIDTFNKDHTHRYTQRSFPYRHRRGDPTVQNHLRSRPVATTHKCKVKEEGNDVFVREIEICMDISGD